MGRRFGQPSQRPQGASLQAQAFPMAIVSRRPLRVGLEYGMTIQGKDVPAPTVQMPVRSSLGQPFLRHRFQLSRNIRLLRTYGFAPGNPILQAESIPNQSSASSQRPRPIAARYGMQTSGGVRASVGSRGSMGSPKRFPKAIMVPPNTYSPPVYGGGTQPQTDDGTS